jgi:cytochrome c551/c552
MSSMHATPPLRPRRSRAEPSGFTVFLLFFGSLILAGVIGGYLWNQSPAVAQGKAFGTANQVGAIAQAPSGGASAGAAQGSGGPGAGAGDAALAAKGQELAQQFGCLACHSTTGQQIVGPTWKGLAGSQRQLANGQTVAADDAYIKESILQPDAKIAKGFAPGIMSGAVTAVEPQIQQGDNLDALVAYIKSLK